ncbi:DNA-directed RNA polymerase III subunit RPC4 [Esox lucius]|uniref:DNA-directed RNA polymerase III subunit RPC4 n=1 Tax=Esox lucius TaxID=8010 RepID=A0A3P8YPJ5_ESOLU|nr:DNA-directed RNA polymerase III subunit RPC4 [Esox lucius]XP_019902584.1 DNA-directed RNA polymerase III subunit RPC4 [Esox lucius]
MICRMTDPSSDADSMAGSSSIRPIVAGRVVAGRTVLSSTPPPGRLTSLRSRDLTLGGFKKKSFIPNVHSVRKSKDELKEEAHVAPKERKEREERHRESRGKRRERPQTIQSHSIFEQGPADTIRKPGGWRGTDLSDSGSSPLAKCVKKERHASEEDEDEILQKLQRDDFLDDPGLKNDAKNRPTQLPLYQSGNFLRTEATTSQRDEPSCDPNAFRVPASASPQHQTHAGPQGPGLQCGPGQGPLSPRQPTVAELFQQLTVSEAEELLFIQLPDTMPGQPTGALVPGQPATAPENTKKDSKSDDKRSSNIKAQDPAGKVVPILSQFSEGFLGKLQIRKSGKVQLLLGDITMDVSGGAAFSFLQQLVSVRLSEGLTGDMTVLGNVKHKLVCSPDFQALLQGLQPSSDKSGTSSAGAIT